MTSRKIKLPAAMANSKARRVMAALSAGGVEARFVGGAVRNAIMRLPAKDVDIATPLRPEQAMKLLLKAKIKCVPTGLKHGTVTAIIDKTPYEITTLRRDMETDGRHATVAFTSDWAEDAKRRDFTMNAIYCSVKGELFDPVGGAKDARAGRVRFVGDAAARIQEDYLRIMRLFRFFAQYGKKPLDAKELKACQKFAPQISTLSGERVRDETLKLLAAKNPVPALSAMQKYKVLPEILPGVKKTSALSKLVRAEKSGDALLRLGALLAENKIFDGAKIAARFAFSNAQKARLIAMLNPKIKNDWRDKTAQNRAIFKMGQAAYLDQLWLRLALSEITAAQFKAHQKRAENFRIKKLPVDGADILALNIPPGEKVGALLREMEEWWIENNFTPSRSAALRHLRKIA